MEGEEYDMAGFTILKLSLYVATYPCGANSFRDIFSSFRHSRNTAFKPDMSLVRVSDIWNHVTKAACPP